MSYTVRLKQQTPSRDCRLSERFAQYCAQQYMGWKPHVLLLGMGKRIFGPLKAKKKAFPLVLIVLIA